MLGEGSFDHGLEQSRFSHLLRTGCGLGRALRPAWGSLQAEMGAEPDGVLRPPPDGAGAGVLKLQHDITLQREARRFQALDVACRSLPAADMRRQAWQNLDSFSTVWVSCWPRRDAHLADDEFREVCTRCVGLPSPACAPHAGDRIAGGRHTLDRNGMQLTTLPLPGDGWRTQHDCLLWRMVEDAREMGVAVQPDVYGLFAACIPQHGRGRFQGLSVRKRQGLVPDMLCTVQWDGHGPARRLLFELKTLHWGTSTYPWEATGRCTAVGNRAAQLPAEYGNKARQVDELYCGTARGDVGPVTARLRAFDPVKGLVFGAWGETSPDVGRLLSALATSGAQRHFRRMGAATPAEAHGALGWLLRRRWSMTAVRENARLLLARLEFVGRGAGAAAARRQVAADGTAARARRESCWQRRGPRRGH